MPRPVAQAWNAVGCCAVGPLPLSPAHLVLKGVLLVLVLPIEGRLVLSQELKVRVPRDRLALTLCTIRPGGTLAVQAVH